MTPTQPTETPYGYCPQCGAVGYSRERRPDGNDTCVNGHKYKSGLALDIPIISPKPTQPTETPRTDAVQWQHSGQYDSGGMVCCASHAGQLERELTAAKAELARVREAGESLRLCLQARVDAGLTSERAIKALAAWEQLK